MMWQALTSATMDLAVRNVMPISCAATRASVLNRTSLMEVEAVKSRKQRNLVPKVQSDFSARSRFSDDSDVDTKLSSTQERPIHVQIAELTPALRWRAWTSFVSKQREDTMMRYACVLLGVNLGFQVLRLL
jgi:hypothetical protein